jgi:hypothetical protein
VRDVRKHDLLDGRGEPNCMPESRADGRIHGTLAGEHRAALKQGCLHQRN